MMSASVPLAMTTLYPAALDQRDRGPENPLMLAKDTKIELIAGVPLFADCSRRELRELAETADEVVVPAGYTLTKEGAAGREFVIIVEGAAEVIRRGTKVNTLALGRLSRRDRARQPRPAHGDGANDAADARARDHGPAFRGLLRRMPSIQIKVLQALAERLPSEFD